MVTHEVNIDSLAKVRALVKILNEYNGRFELVSGSSSVNAKSIMGIFSMDITKPFILNIYDDEFAPEIIRKIKEEIAR